MNEFTRIDIFTNLDAYIEFMEWAKTKNPKTKEDMKRLLAEYRQPDIIINERKEIVEHKLHQAVKEGKIKLPKGDKK